MEAETKNETRDKINDLLIKIDQCRYWLSDGRTSNPITIRNRKAQLREYQKELSEYTSQKGN